MPKNTLVRLSPPIICNHNTREGTIYNFGLFQETIQESPAVATVRLADGGLQYVNPLECFPMKG